MAEKREKLFDQFPPVTKEEWMAKVEADLKGADFQKKLVWRTNEGFNVQPMYMLDDIKDLKTTDSLPGEYPYVRGTRDNNEWAVAQNVEAKDAAKANEVALDILNKGVTALTFIIDDENINIETLLAGVDLSKVKVNLKLCPSKAVAVAKKLVDYIVSKGAQNTFCGTIDFDPYRKALKHGSAYPGSIKDLAVELLKVVTPVKCLKVFAVDSYLLNNAGAYITQELGYALAWGAEWMTLLTDAGVDASEAAKRIAFNMGVSSNYFMEIAKFRAARMLWAQIAKQYGATDDACKMFVHAITTEFNQTIYDAYVNLLRSQTEAMSAAIAGVNVITVTPFDKPYKTPDDFSERLARNQQLLLKEESHLDKVLDPAGGSYYVETLTVSIANEAWKLFVEVEDNGGFQKMLETGKVQEAVNASAEKRHSDVARRKEILLGSNQYPNFNEFALDKIQTKECCCSCSAEKTGVALNTKRAASDFENLRLDTERSGKRPKVFMLTIGNLAMRLARAQFSANFFGCAGYEIIDNNGFATVAEGVKAAMDKAADVIVLCSSDDEYAQYALEAKAEIADRALFVVAGAPACMEELQTKGITEFIHVRSNVLDTLKAFNAKLLK